MKILFAGPSLHGCDLAGTGIRVRPPARQGDLQSAVLDGANVIGLVDGVFETVAAVWHKEILFALSQGVVVLGAASMGALRAAECKPFGMMPIGEIAERYARGLLDDDAAVAQLHAPAELGFLPLTQALVDCEAAIEALSSSGRLQRDEASALLASARSLFFKLRTWRAVIRQAGYSGAKAAELRAILEQGGPGLKRRDALSLVNVMTGLPDRRSDVKPEWSLSRTPAWIKTLETREL
ncbi:TfuA-like protein [Aureimonas sp. AU12]|uniref:TfuA-like protein n=1 Tax=Aureimonas sp. AU12 TaxID=1638161 RepID=UPI0009ECBA74